MAAVFQYRTRNLRDIGGHAGTRGIVRTGMLFRSAQLDKLTPKERDMILRLGVRRAIDLRDDDEKAAEGLRLSVLVPEVETLEFPLMGNRPHEQYEALFQSLGRVQSTKELRGWMCGQYSHIINRSRLLIIRALSCVMACEEPQLFFCFSGKDRSGIMAMLLEMVLGVDRSEIMRDYLRTNNYVLGLPFWRIPSQAARQQYAYTGMPVRVIDILSEAHPAFLATALCAVADAGGIDAWLTSGVDGLDAELLESFRARMLAE